jgi:outer membrane lipoprotein-sorting protein
MKFLRTVSTRTLLATIAGVVAVIVGGTAIAVAASSGGPVPPRESLARAVHGVLTAPSVTGISARITFTNNLINASNIQGPTDPLLQGASGRLWYSPGTHRLRIELQSDNGDGQVVVNGRRFWVYDPASNTAYEGTLPVQAHKATDHQHSHALPSVSQIQADLNKLAQHVNLSGAIPGDVAGQPTYTVRVSPKHDGGLLGDVQLAWDAARGVPLRFGIYANGDSTPVLELKATDISFGAVPSSDFAVSPPSGAKVVKVSAPSGHRATTRKSGKHTLLSGEAAVARHLHFKLVAPSTLVGQPRRSVTLLSWGGSPAALVTYGQNLGGIAVVEQSASSGGKLNFGGASGAHGPGLSLPTVSINGASGQELATALGTIVRFTSGKVTYTVIGSVPPAAAEAAARAL